MSDRNTALLLPGHVDPQRIADAVSSLPDTTPQDFEGDEAPRVGWGTREGRDFTWVGLRLFELGGLLLLDRLALPEADEAEEHMARALSGQVEYAVFVYYDEEQGVGGSATYQGGVLIDRQNVDGRWDEPVLRTLNEELALGPVDPGDWVWPALGDAVEMGSSRIVGPGVRTDDDIEVLIASCTLQEVPKVGSAPKAQASGAQARGGTSGPETGRKRDKLKRAFKGFLKR